MSKKFLLPSSFGESSGEEILLIFVGEDVKDEFISRIDDIEEKSFIKSIN